jgi:hypothetical protein
VFAYTRITAPPPTAWVVRPPEVRRLAGVALCRDQVTYRHGRFPRATAAPRACRLSSLLGLGKQGAPLGFTLSGAPYALMGSRSACGRLVTAVNTYLSATTKPPLNGESAAHGDLELGVPAVGRDRDVAGFRGRLVDPVRTFDDDYPDIRFDVERALLVVSRWSRM